jgi:hypothetical protein
MSAEPSPSERKGRATLEDAKALISALLSDFAGEKIPSERLGQHLKDLVRLSRMLSSNAEILAAIQADPEWAQSLKSLMIKTGTLPPEPETLP